MEVSHFSQYPSANWRWPNFSPRELASKREGELLIDPPSMDKLQTLRNDLARPMVITSAYRSPAHNRAVGGATGSLHLQGKAFDVVLGNHDPHAFIAAARAAGFTGIGTYPKQGFIHIDTGRARTWGDPFPKTATNLAPEPVKARPPVIDSVPPAPLPSPTSPRRHQPCQGRDLHPCCAGCCRRGLFRSEMTMNPLMLFETLRDLSALIEQANRLAGPDKRWSLAFTNRSFIVACVAFVAAAALMNGLPFPMPIDVTAETVYAVITVAGLLWAGIERMLGKTRAVWNRKQAVEALMEADALTDASNKIPGVRSELPRR